MTQHEQFSVHPEPVWRDRSNFIINAPLPEPGRFEQLWCRQVTDNSFEVCCIPFFLYDVALGDVVETRDDADRQYVMSRVVEPSGRYVFRVHFERPMLQNRGDTVVRLNKMGALLEWSSPSLLAVDARDAAHGQGIAEFLAERETEGQLIYETGKT